MGHRCLTNQRNTLSRIIIMNITIKIINFNISDTTVMVVLWVKKEEPSPRMDQVDNIIIIVNIIIVNVIIVIIIIIMPVVGGLGVCS